MVNAEHLKLKNVSFFYKKGNYILNDLNVDFYGGKIVALLGINGSGKTTLFKILTGINLPKNGFLFYNGKKLNSDNIIKYKENIGFMPEFLHLYKNMLVRDVLLLLGNLKGFKNFDVDKILNTIYLFKHSQKKVKALSKGMKQRLNLGQAIIGDPKVILFDEPSNGFDCSSISMFYKILRNLSLRGSIILISSHHLAEIYGNVDKILILSSGKIIKELDLNSFNFKNEYIYKDINIYLENILDNTFLSYISKNYKFISVKNKNYIFGKIKSKNVINLISDLIKSNFIIKDIRIEDRILENILVNLS